MKILIFFKNLNLHSTSKNLIKTIISEKSSMNPNKFESYKKKHIQFNKGKDKNIEGRNEYKSFFLILHEKSLKILLNFKSLYVLHNMSRGFFFLLWFLFLHHFSVTRWDIACLIVWALFVFLWNLFEAFLLNGYDWRNGYMLTLLPHIRTWPEERALVNTKCPVKRLITSEDFQRVDFGINCFVNLKLLKRRKSVLNSFFGNAVNIILHGIRIVNMFDKDRWQLYWQLSLLCTYQLNILVNDILEHCQVLVYIVKVDVTLDLID